MVVFKWRALCFIRRLLSAIKGSHGTAALHVPSSCPSLSRPPNTRKEKNLVDRTTTKLKAGGGSVGIGCARGGPPSVARRADRNVRVCPPPNAMQCNAATMHMRTDDAPAKQKEIHECRPSAMHWPIDHIISLAWHAEDPSVRRSAQRHHIHIHVTSQRPARGIIFITIF